MVEYFDREAVLRHLRALAEDLNARNIEADFDLSEVRHSPLGISNGP